MTEPKLRDVMSRNPIVLQASDTAADAARMMQQRDVGNVLVERDGELCGIVTDRDIVVRCIAEMKDPRIHRLSEFCTEELATLDPDSSLDDAIAQMADRGIRRLPILNAGAAEGIVSLGDLAQARDPGSLLGRISASAATR